jgi:signal transduction histidine kinase/ligand-binding sensor domain-containing protein
VCAERLPVRIYTSADGLGSSFINSLMRDSRGFLWVCTRDGLSRFDGSRFVTYQIGDSGAAPGIERIIESRKGVYWISTTGGLFRFDPDVPPIADQSKSAGRATLNAEFVSEERGVLYEDHAGDLWLGTSNLYRVLQKDNKTVFEKIELGLPVNPLISFGILRIAEGPDGSLWIATSWGVVRRFADDKQVYYSIDDPHTNAFTSLLPDRYGRIWVGRQKGGLIIKPESRDELSLREALTIRNLDKLSREGTDTDPINLPEKPGEILKYSDAEGVVSGPVRFLSETADGHIWISTNKGVTDFDGRGFHVYTKAQGFVEGPAHLIEDTSENLWMGGPNGLIRWDRGGLTSYLAADGLSNPYILVTNQTRDGHLYVMSSDLSVSLFDGARFQTIRPRLPSDSQVLWSANPVFQDSAGEWWFLTNGKLYRYAATKDFHELAWRQPRATYDSHDGLSGDQMFHIFEDSRGDLWISTHGLQEKFGLSRWNRASGEFHTLTEAEGFPANRAPSSFAEDRHGNIFFGFYEGGLVRYAEGRFTQFTSADGLPGGLITALYLDRQGRLWIGSAQSGLSRVDEPVASHPRFVTFTAENGMASNNVRSITEDLNGNVYAGTARGIDRLSPDATRIKHYSVSDGLAGDFVSTAFRDAAGALWFGTPNGLSRLVPRPDKSLRPPPVRVSGLRIAGERRAVSELGSIEIPLPELTHSQNNLQIDFFGIDFSADEPLRYQYKLEGADQDWGVPTDQRSVTYARLQPGAYRFLVRAVNADGHASHRPAIVSFRILAPIWLRWWFIGLVVLSTSALFFSLYRYRMARLQEVNAALREAKRAEESLRKSREERLVELEQVRKRIATDLHDDIGSSLTRICLLSEVAQRQGIERPADGPLPVIAGLSRELVDSMSDIVWAINPEKDSLGDLTQRMRHFASDVCAARGIDCRFWLPNSERDLRVGANVRRELFLIFKEAVNNLVRHSGCSEAGIEFRVEAERLFLKVTDNGRGFDAQGKSNGHGLTSMRARTECLNGTVEIVSDREVGTAMTFVIPMSHHDRTAIESQT